MSHLLWRILRPPALIGLVYSKSVSAGDLLPANTAKRSNIKGYSHCCLCVCVCVHIYVCLLAFVEAGLFQLKRCVWCSYSVVYHGHVRTVSCALLKDPNMETGIWKDQCEDESLALSLSLSVSVFNNMISCPSFPLPFSARVALGCCRLQGREEDGLLLTDDVNSEGAVFKQRVTRTVLFNPQAKHTTTMLHFVSAGKASWL